MKHTLPAVADRGDVARIREVACVARACDVLRAFRSAEEILELRHVAERTRLNKATTLRLLRTLESKGLLQKVGPRGYRSLFKPVSARRFRLGYAAQSSVVPFISTVTESIRIASGSAGFDLVALNNDESRKIALRNADRFVFEKVDLVMEFQLIGDIADAIAEKFASAGIPLIAIDDPHPGATYFGADNYKAGYIGGNYLGRWAATNWKGIVDEVLFLSARLGGPVLETRMLGIADGLASALPHTAEKAHYQYDVKGHFDHALETVRKHLLHSHAGHILVGCVNDPAALGALEAFREFGAEDHAAIIGQGATAEGRHEMRRPASRLVGSVAYFPEAYGERLMALASQILEGARPPSAVFTKHQLVTPANVNKIYANDVLLGQP